MKFRPLTNHPMLCLCISYLPVYLTQGFKLTFISPHMYNNPGELCLGFSPACEVFLRLTAVIKAQRVFDCSFVLPQDFQPCCHLTESSKLWLRCIMGRSRLLWGFGKLVVLWVPVQLLDPPSLGKLVIWISGSWSGGTGNPSPPFLPPSSHVNSSLLSCLLSLPQHTSTSSFWKCVVLHISYLSSLCREQI